MLEVGVEHEHGPVQRVEHFTIGVIGQSLRDLASKSAGSQPTQPDSTNLTEQRVGQPRSKPTLHPFDPKQTVGLGLLHRHRIGQSTEQRDTERLTEGEQVDHLAHTSRE